MSAEICGREDELAAAETFLVPLHGVGPVPLNVANDCNWTWNCTPPPLGWDPHPNTEGYGVIARAFAHVVNP
jgi:hypothetical protein